MDSRLDSPDHFVAIAVVQSILFSTLTAIRFGTLRCISAVSDAAGQTQLLTYRPGWGLATVGQPPTVGADLATRVPKSRETDGDKPGRILGFPRLTALAVFCRRVGTAPKRLPADDGSCLRARETNLLLFFNG